MEEVIEIIYTTCIVTVSLLIWKCWKKIKKKKKKIKDNEIVFGIVKNAEIYFNPSFEGIKFYYKGKIKLEKKQITEENFILIEPNFEIIFLNYLSKRFNLN